MLRDSLITLLTRALLFCTSTVTAVLTARLLGPEGRGIYALLSQTALLLVLVANLGLSPATVYLAGRGQFSARVLFWNGLGASIVLGLATVPLAWLAHQIAPQLFQGVAPPLLAVIVLSVPVTLAAQVLTGLLLGRQRLIAYNLLGGLQGLVGAAALIIALAVEPSVRAAVAALVVSALFALLSTVGYLAMSEPGVLRPTWARAAWRAAFSYGLRGQAANVVQYLSYRMGFFLLNAFAGPAAVGLLSVATVLAEALWYVTNAVATVLFPRVASLGEGPRSVALATQAARCGFWLTVALALGLAAASWLLIPLVFGPPFAAATTPLLWLLPGTAAFALTNVLAGALAGWGRPGLNAWASAMCFVTTGGLALLAIPRWGPDGAAMAMSAGYLTGTLATLWFFVRHAGTTVLTLLVPTSADMMLLRATLRQLARRNSERAD